MVKLNKIYCEPEGLFEPIEFKNGLNIIIGKYGNTEKRSSKKGVNAVGKSTLVRLIDFALLNDAGKTELIAKKNAFLNPYSIILEFSAWGNNYLIKRSFKDYKIVDFGKRNNEKRKYTLETFNDSELRLILGSIFFGEENYKGNYENKWFRTLMKFFIKDDLTNYKREDPTKFMHGSKGVFEAYSYNLFLLGITNVPLMKYDKNKKDKKALEERQKGIIASVEEETGKSIERLQTEIGEIDQKINLIKKNIDEFYFEDSYETILEKLTELTGAIQVKNRFLNILKRKLEEYSETFSDFSVNIDKNRIVELYKSVKNAFGDIVKKSIEETIEFRESLSKHRKNFILDRKNELEEEIEKISKDRNSLETKRSELYKILDEKKAFDKIKNSYSELVEERAKKEKLATYHVETRKLNRKISETSTKISENIEKINYEIEKCNSQITDLSMIFRIIANAVTEIKTKEEGFFTIISKPNKSSPIQFIIDIPKTESLGKNKLKVWIYDMMVFLNIIKNQFKYPHFLIHDGVFHSVDHATVIRAFNYAYSETIKQPNFQYIITVNEDELQEGPDKQYGSYNFNIDDHIIAAYSDTPEKMIFKRQF